ncbi:MAG: DNA gyrase subunit A [Bdellovibrionaceae bacterium]|jgi:DNA gyrase subunit A|nr:DNA gyrase subunit A [Pseudobdellovibrionaceae bacterium]
MENTPTQDNITKIDINREMRDAYLQYSMSVIVGRALPDVRDGLKPVHRRILFAMHELNNTYSKPYKKSARIVGDVIGKYHPHGDTAVYDTMVRMAQDFSLRYPLVDGQGNFGSIDGDSPAAQRYTEVRMTKLSDEILEDIEKETVPFQPNYDDSLLIPSVLPSKYPNLLANGSSGIAVGMATNIPPHNLDELIEGTIALIENSELTIDELMTHIKGPDFPTAGIISGTSGINSAFKKGRGIITVKAVTEIVPFKDREQIIITELPYQVNKAKLIESIANLVKDKKVEGISDIRDESSREGMRAVITLKRNEHAQVILNRLYKYTQLQVSFGIIMLALDSKNRPKVFNLKEMLQAFVDHRKDVVTKRCIFELKKAEARAHILEGLKKALSQIDEIIKTIKSSKEASVAKSALQNEFGFSEIQSQAILDMKLQRLTGLEQQKIEKEYQELLKKVDWLKMVLGDIKEIYKIIKEELIEIKAKFKSPRKTRIEPREEEAHDEDLVALEESIVVMTKNGSIKRISTEEYSVQKRGGKGVKGSVKDSSDDYVWKVIYADTLTNLLCFSDRGKVYWSKVYKLPLGTRTSKGKSIKNVINLSSNEETKAILPVKDFNPNEFVVLVTEKGTIKKTDLEKFSSPRENGIIALTTTLDDNLIQAKLSSGTSDIFLATQEGMSIRFNETQVRPMGRSAKGVKGITIGKNDKVIGMSVIPKESDATVVIITEGGFGKRTNVSEYRAQTRGGVGIITQKVNDKVGKLVAANVVSGTEQILITTNNGQAIRMKCSDISTVGRNTLGVKVINLKEGERVTGVAILDAEVDETQE